MVKNIKTIYLFYNDNHLTLEEFIKKINEDENFDEIHYGIKPFLSDEIKNKINDELNKNDLFKIDEKGKIIFKYSKNNQFIEEFLKKILELFQNTNYKFYVAYRLLGNIRCLTMDQFN